MAQMQAHPQAPTKSKASTKQSSLYVGSYSASGPRPYNEDNLDVRRTNQRLIALLADGMGGGEVGASVSNQAIKFAAESLQEQRNDSDVGAAPFGQSPDPFVRRLLRALEGTEHRAGAVNEQGSQVAVAALGNASELSLLARGIFLGCESKPGGEVASILEVSDLAAGRCDHCRCGKQTDTGD